MFVNYSYLLLIFGGLFLLFIGLGIIFIVFGIRTRMHAKGKCGAVLVPAKCIEIQSRDYTSELGSHDGTTTYQRGSENGVYQYTYKGIQYTETAFLSTNLKKYMPKQGRCTIAINAKKPRKIYAPAGVAAGNILLFIGILFVVMTIFFIIILYVHFLS